MLMQGYEYIEHNQETLYANLFDYDKDVKVYVGEYIKYNAFRYSQINAHRLLKS